MTTDVDDCGCEPDAGDDGHEPTHFSRTCTVCGFQWEALHCAHDGVQNPCPGCGWVAPGARTPMQVLGFDATARYEPSREDAE